MNKLAAALLVPLVLSASPDYPVSAGSNVVSAALFQNPVVGEGADPWVVKHTDGYYYYTQTTGGNITIWKSKNLSGIEKGEKKVVWTPASGAPNSQHMWAPELHFLNGKWYIYYAASAGDMGKQRMYVLESEGADPLGPYHHPEGTDFGKISDPSDKWAIDGTILEHENKLYFVWSGWEGDVNVSQNLYIAPLENPWTISGERVEISRPELAWEKNGFPLINEGPQILKNKQGQVFLIYSASGSWTDEYCLGMLTLKGDPLRPASWTKQQSPVFQKNPAAHVYGPGHNSFVKSPDGKEDWIVYHAAKFQGAGWNRNVRMQQFFWNADGTPNFGVPVAADTLQRAPGGEAKGKLTPQFPGLTYKYEAEHATVNRAKVVHNTSASGGAKVGYMDFDDSYVNFDVQVPPGEYTMKVRYSNGMGQQTSHLVALNGQFKGELLYESHGWDTWKEAEMDITFQQGQNSIRLSKGHLYTELDAITLVPKKTTVYKYEAEHAKLNAAQIVTDQQASNQQRIGSLTDKHSLAEFLVETPKDGIYELQASYITDRTSTQTVHINGRFTASMQYQPAQAWQSAAVKVKLKKGVNRITFVKGKGAVELDYISLRELK